MIKKLDKLILKAFIGPFLATFFIAFFVLMMQSLWKYIDDLVGKGLDFITICQFIWYASASMLMLAMPIAILISSIMTFGNLGESFELVAIKSSGISLLRFMRPLILFSLLLCGITFVFANYVIPIANLKFITLYSEIYVKKPAFDLKEGVFYNNIPNYAIKVGKKDPDGKIIYNIVIFEQNNALQDNAIVAEKGVMKISDDQNYLEFNLQNGYRYQEKGNIADTSTEFFRVGFKTFNKLFDLSGLQQQKTNDSVFRRNYRMLSANQLAENIDSLKKSEKDLDSSLYKQLNIELKYSSVASNKKITAISDTPITYQNMIPASLTVRIDQISLEKVTSIKNIIQRNATEIENKEKEIRLHGMEWHRKYSLSLACLVLFFIGAPLGSIIRKGGFGMPLVLAIVFFLIFHLLMMFGEKFIKEGITTPLIGMWMTNFVYIPLGAFLIYKAMNDSQLFNKDFYTKWFNRLLHLFRIKK
ncbi:MAG: YjgP/YjgQ family permease [Ferruginibacter sp.]|nr:YjgP/YjgQ family permease [Ferruginibacter sp.]